MKRRVLSLLLIVCMLSMTTTVFAASYTDTDEHWAEAYIDYWSEEGVIAGYDDDSFQPDSNMTRAEVAAVLTKVAGLSGTADLSEYSDVTESDWYYAYISACVAAGVMEGYGDGTIGPDDQVTREQAMKLLSSIVGAGEEYAQTEEFADYDAIDDWAMGYVNLMTEIGVVNGYPDGSVLPQGNVTRAEFVKMLYSLNQSMITEPGIYACDGDCVIVCCDGVTLTGTVDVVVISSQLVGAETTLDGLTANRVLMQNDAGILTMTDSRIDGELVVGGNTATISGETGSADSIDVVGDVETVTIDVPGATITANTDVDLSINGEVYQSGEQVTMPAEETEEIGETEETTDETETTEEETEPEEDDDEDDTVHNGASKQLAGYRLSLTAENGAGELTVTSSELLTKNDLFIVETGIVIVDNYDQIIEYDAVIAGDLVSNGAAAYEGLGASEDADWDDFITTFLDTYGGGLDDDEGLVAKFAEYDYNPTIGQLGVGAWTLTGILNEGTEDETTYTLTATISAVYN